MPASLTPLVESLAAPGDLLWALLGAAIVGLSLGLLGSGGAILTIPILVYLLGHDEKVAIVESLAIVGGIALFASGREAWRRQVDWMSVLLLAVPGMAGSAFGAWVSHGMSGRAQLTLLAALMLVASAFMFRRAAPRPHGPPAARWVILLVGALQGFGLGVATGLVGIGGGFLIVPVLVLLRRLPMPVAVGTSLALIAFNCTAGLTEHAWSGLAPFQRIDWPMVAIFIAVGIAGSLAGSRLGRLLPPMVVRRIFAATLLAVAGYVVLRIVMG